ncbi:MAG TPA: 2-hydroxyacyl-CoA dehydratase [Candidatus Eisenbergiella merdipullorum]|uniref:2-hydroxyacyl-CoA dehydratase n=1 Tax=Candidatus Eisenbergiella merdipullorum TaxID=2838553 RepID=A0A9D2I8W1_9FIRM|nr:2-hydroxyacyl-CoA dehydratase [Candidatus Eisenbergiella merdipullorum]
MLGYMCKYAPIEIFESMGVEMKRIDPQVSNFTQADMKMHPNICSFAKGVLEDVMAGDYEGVILTTCCDSIRRGYDVLRQELPDKFIYILDTPRITKDAGITLYEGRIRKMIAAYEAFSGKTFEEAKLADILRKKQKEQSISLGESGCRNASENDTSRNKQADSESVPASSPAGKHAPRKKNIGLIGARANESIVRILKERNANLAFDLTCTGLKRKYLLEPDQILTGYTRGLLSQFPCMRMEAAAGRDELIERYAGSVDGLIYHTVQFCDNYSYEYAWLKKRLDRPMLLLETDYTKQSYGQILTRVEAFLESLGQAPEDTEAGRAAAQKMENAEGKENTGNMYVMGIDSGSTSTNAVIMDKNRKILASAVVRTGAKSGESAQRILDEVLGEAGLKREDISWIVSTGYGRVSIPFADENVTEISCHGRGAHYFNPAVRTILDIGGQDSKAIRLNEKGEVADFVMNDKCAAGTGRFLEMIARSLEVDVDELGPIALQSKEEIEITSMCSVFAESEVISLIANNREKSDIANGICRAVANKSYSLLKRVGLEEEFMMTGGVAKNAGVVRAVEEKLGTKLYICPEPEIVGAAGAALYALDRMEERA